MSIENFGECLVYYHEGERFTRVCFLSRYKPSTLVKHIKLCEGSEKDCKAISVALNALMYMKNIELSELIKFVKPIFKKKK